MTAIYNDGVTSLSDGARTDSNRPYIRCRVFIPSRLRCTAVVAYAQAPTRHHHPREMTNSSCSSTMEPTSALRGRYCIRRWNLLRLPSLFLQLYTLHGMFQNQMVPLVYFLLPNKTKTTYTRAFRLLKQAAVDRGLQLSPAVIQVCVM